MRSRSKVVLPAPGAPGSRYCKALHSVPAAFVLPMPPPRLSAEPPGWPPRTAAPGRGSGRPAVPVCRTVPPGVPPLQSGSPDGAGQPPYGRRPGWPAPANAPDPSQSPGLSPETAPPGETPPLRDVRSAGEAPPLCPACPPEDQEPPPAETEAIPGPPAGRPDRCPFSLVLTAFALFPTRYVDRSTVMTTKKRPRPKPGAQNRWYFTVFRAVSPRTGCSPSAWPGSWDQRRRERG